jgi:hypothetical protein
MFGGMDMMLKSMGIDPKEIMGKAEKFGALFAHMTVQLQNIEAQNLLIMTKLDIDPEIVARVTTPPLKMEE